MVLSAVKRQKNNPSMEETIGQKDTSTWGDFLKDMRKV